MKANPEKVANPKPQPRREAAESPCEPLSRHKAGQMVRIHAVGGDAAFQRRLRDLGLRPGNCIEVSQHGPCGVVVTSDGLKLALAPEAAEHVLVSPCAPRR